VVERVVALLKRGPKEGEEVGEGVTRRDRVEFGEVLAVELLEPPIRERVGVVEREGVGAEVEDAVPLKGEEEEETVAEEVLDGPGLPLLLGPPVLERDAPPVKETEALPVGDALPLPPPPTPLLAVGSPVETAVTGEVAEGTATVGVGVSVRERVFVEVPDPVDVGGALSAEVALKDGGEEVVTLGLLDWETLGREEEVVEGEEEGLGGWERDTVEVWERVPGLEAEYVEVLARLRVEAADPTTAPVAAKEGVTVGEKEPVSRGVALPVGEAEGEVDDAGEGLGEPEKEGEVEVRALGVFWALLEALRDTDTEGEMVMLTFPLEGVRAGEDVVEGVGFGLPL